METKDYEFEAREKGTEIAKEIENQMNHCPYNVEFAESLIHTLVHCTHPYLRNEIFNKLILGVVQEMAVSPQHDPRDHSAYEAAKYIKDKVDNAYDKEHINIVGLPQPTIKAIARHNRGCWDVSNGYCDKRIYASYREDLEEVRKKCEAYRITISEIKKDDIGFYFKLY